MAVGAGLGGAALLGAGAAAVGAGLQALDGDGLVAALDRLHKGQRNGNLHIRPLDRGVGVAGAGAAAKAPKAAPAEEALEDIADIVKAEARRSAVTAGPAAVRGGVARVDAGKAELIVPAALFGVGEDLIGLPGLLELGLGLLIPRVQVRVILFGQGTIGLFDLIIGGLAGHAKHLIVISFLCQTRTPPSPADPGGHCLL